MKFLLKIIVLIGLVLGNAAYADKILILPADLYSNNYYSFPEVSQIIAQDVAENFTQNSKMSAVSMYEVKKKFSENSALKNSATYAMNKYKNSNSVDFPTLKKLADAFGVKSILIISSMVTQDNTKRNVWEVLEISSAFNAISNYNLETRAVLTDNVNDIVMWSGKYNRNLGDNESRFWAKNSAQAASQLEKLRAYSKDIVSKNIAASITLRFYPKEVKQSTPTTNPQNTDITDFRPNPMGTYRYLTPEPDEIQIDPVYEF